VHVACLGRDCRFCICHRWGSKGSSPSAELGICNHGPRPTVRGRAIIKHYLGRDLMRALAAIDCLVEFVSKEGLA
jgi:hypothetical protein